MGFQEKVADEPDRTLPGAGPESVAVRNDLGTVRWKCVQSPSTSAYEAMEASAALARGLGTLDNLSGRSAESKMSLVTAG